MTAILDRPITGQSTKTKARPWLGLSAVLAATIMNLLDSTVVNVAAPAIRADLGGSYAALQWTAASYTLAMAVGLLTAGRLGDMFGRKRMLLIGVGGFMLASLLCTLAISPAMLIGSRVVQGLFAAAMIPQGFGLIRDLFPPKEIGKAFGTFGPVIGLSTILGPVVAGVLVNADIAGTGWRMVFGINLPLGLFALLAGGRALPDSTGSGQRRLDVVGALLGAAGMALVVYPLVQGRELGWPLWMVAVLVAGIGVLAVFVRRQLRLRRDGGSPLVQLSVFAKRSYTSGVGFIIVFFGGIAGFALSVGMFLQLGIGFSAIHAALTMAAWAVGAFIGSGVAATVGAKLGRRILHIGLSLMAVGIAGVYVVLRLAGTDLSSWDLTVPLLVYGAGMGMIFVPLFGIIMSEIADHEVGSASGLLESLQQLGSTLGVAVLGTIFFGILGTSALVGAETVALITLGLAGAAFAIAFLLPHKRI